MGSTIGNLAVEHGKRLPRDSNIGTCYWLSTIGNLAVEHGEILPKDSNIGTSIGLP